MAGFILPALIAYGLKKTSDSLSAKRSMPTIPGTPTIDQAAQNQQDSDRLRARRGVLANIFAPSGGSQPSVGSKTLLGQ